ncbi:Gfo/Idh/MocA family oxidoreductase [bacterium]|nr:Gfo/Idh/MocA family oxidoreductase [bacterium]
MTKSLRIAFLGSGGIARAHAFALDSLKHYYPDAPEFERVVVASPTKAHRESFASRYGFQEACSPDAVWERDDLDAVYLLGGNETHTPQIVKALEHPTIQRIYSEKPIAASSDQLATLEALLTKNHDKFFMMGFQFLQKSPIRKALAHWQSGNFGTPVHFRAEYLHSGYLSADYRQKRTSRLAPMPLNGSAVDLGSHVLSLLTAFLGDGLNVRDVSVTNGQIKDVPTITDLCTIALMEETQSGAIGTMTASRITAGTGDQLKLELHGTEGSILFDTAQPDCYYSFQTGESWQRHDVNSDYLPASKFPSDYVPTGWLRALIHNHYLFLGGNPEGSFLPDLAHGVQVQRLIQQIADQFNAR